RNAPPLQFKGVNADHSPASRDTWSATVSRVDGSIRLNPQSGSGGRKLTDGANDSLRDGERHSPAGVSNRGDGLSLAHVTRGRQGQAWKVVAFHLQQSDVAVRINVNYFGRELLSAGKNSQQGTLTAG